MIDTHLQRRMGPSNGAGLAAAAIEISPQSAEWIIAKQQAPAQAVMRTRPPVASLTIRLCTALDWPVSSASRPVRDDATSSNEVGDGQFCCDKNFFKAVVVSEST
jgi:hypothetical protein